MSERTGTDLLYKAWMYLWMKYTAFGNKDIHDAIKIINRLRMEIVTERNVINPS